MNTKRANPHPNLPPIRGKGQIGSVILEALIAILIFSIGILALVGMQATAINSVADSKYRSTAGFLANQIIGTIWANSPPNAAIFAASNVVAMDITPVLNFCTPAQPAPSLCQPGVPVCPGSALVGSYLTYTVPWLAEVANELPNGTATISICPATPINNGAFNATTNQVTVTIHWQPPKDAVPHTHAVSTFIN